MVWSSEGTKLGAGDGPVFDSPAPHRLARARRGRRRWGPPGGGTRSAVDDPPRLSGDPDEPSPRPLRGGHRVGLANMTSDTLHWYNYGRSSMPLARISGRSRVGCSPVVRCAGLGPAALARGRDEILPCRESLVSPVYCGGPSRVRSHGQSRAGRVRCPRHTSGFRWITPIEADRIGRPHDHRPRLYRGGMASGRTQWWITLPTVSWETSRARVRSIPPRSLRNGVASDRRARPGRSLYRSDTIPARSPLRELLKKNHHGLGWAEAQSIVRPRPDGPIAPDRARTAASLDRVFPSVLVFPPGPRPAKVARSLDLSQGGASDCRVLIKAQSI
jgi:hypothetical protein